ncbi:MAG: NMD3-related protein [Candidatus Woesearchaeota archaeon]
MDKNSPVEDALEFKKFKPLKLCSSCKRIGYKNRWFKPDKELFLSILANNLKNPKDAKSIRIEDVFAEKKRFTIIFSFKKQDFVAEIPATTVLCKECSAKKSRAYSGILQIRNINENDFEEINRFVMKTIESEKGVATKIERLNHGIDYYINSMKTLKKAGYKVVRKFGGAISFNEKIFTRDSLKSKDVYRVNVLVKLPEFKIGDLVSNDNEIVLLTGHKKKLSGINIMNNRMVILDEKKIKNLKIEEPKRAVVVRTYPRIEVLDPETFESVPIANEEFLKSKNKKVNINDEILVVIKNQLAYFCDKVS